ncbi:MAG TPA: PqqD family protein [Thermoanaerobaculia bacterium]|nr:PqqD family protein [Thermoanaerobaculia bacterium]
MLLDSTRGVYLLLNRSGVEIWTALAEGCQPDEITATLAGRRSLPEEEARREVEAFVRDLLRRGMLVET